MSRAGTRLGYSSSGVSARCPRGSGHKGTPSFCNRIRILVIPAKGTVLGQLPMSHASFRAPQLWGADLRLSCQCLQEPPDPALGQQPQPLTNRKQKRAPPCQAGPWPPRCPLLPQGHCVLQLRQAPPSAYPAMKTLI